MKIKRITVRLAAEDLEALNDIKGFMEWLLRTKVTYSDIVRLSIHVHRVTLLGLESYGVYRQVKAVEEKA